jgi:hypothetical protein
MPRIAFVSTFFAAATWLGCAASAAAPQPTPSQPRPAPTLIWPGDNHSNPAAAPARAGEPTSKFGQPQARRTLSPRRAQAKQARGPALQSIPLPMPQPLQRATELVQAPVAAVIAAAAAPQPAPLTTQAIPATPPATTQLAQSPPQSIPPPRARNEASEAADGSYMTRAAGYLNDAVDYVRDGLGSLSSYMPDWRFGWGAEGQDAAGRTHEQLLIEAMSAAGFELVSVARDGTLVTTVTYTFRHQRRPSASDRVLAGKLAAELAATSGSIGGQLEQTMIKSALENGDATPLSIQTFELQTKPYPWLRSVAGPRTANR